MSRRRSAEKRQILPDPKYKDLVIAKFTNSLMLHGKKSAAEGIIYGAFDIVFDKTKKEPLSFFHDAINNVKPNLEVKSRRVGGATYQVPMEVSQSRYENALRFKNGFEFSKNLVESSYNANTKYYKDTFEEEFVPQSVLDDRKALAGHQGKVKIWKKNISNNFSLRPAGA